MINEETMYLNKFTESNAAALSTVLVILRGGLTWRFKNRNTFCLTAFF